MDIEIRHYLSCSYQLEAQSGVWDSLVVLDSGLRRSEFVMQHSVRSLQLNFDDITKPQPRKIEPNFELVSAAIEFGVQSEKLFVCCRAGQSRSAAIAFAIAFEKLGESAAIELLNPRRHSPNYLILRIADNVIARPGILDAYDRWGYQNGDVRLTDFLDEIVGERDELISLGARDRISVR